MNCLPNETVFTVADLTALKRAVMTGVKEVQFTDKKVVYRSMDEITAAIRMMEAEIYPCGGCGSGRRYAVTSKML